MLIVAIFGAAASDRAYGFDPIAGRHVRNGLETDRKPPPGAIMSLEKSRRAKERLPQAEQWNVARKFEMSGKPAPRTGLRRH
jgi:hypothetical protein